MGEVVGAAIVSHVPPIVASDDDLAIIYGAKGTTLVEGLQAAGGAGSFLLLSPSQSVLKVLQLSRLDSVFTIVEQM